MKQKPKVTEVEVIACLLNRVKREQRKIVQGRAAKRLDVSCEVFYFVVMIQS